MSENRIPGKMDANAIGIELTVEESLADRERVFADSQHSLAVVTGRAGKGYNLVRYVV